MYQNDQWNVTDVLGMAAAGDQLAKMVMHVAPPFTTAIVGKWGAGKTSLMQRAFVTLGGNPISTVLPLGSTTPTDASSLSSRTLSRRAELRWEPKLYKVVDQSLCVWYSPWQHQNAANPLIPLLLEIKQQVMQRYQSQSRADDAAGGKTADTFRRAGLATLTLLERVADAACMLTKQIDNPVFTGTTEAVVKAWKGEGELSDGQRFHLQFEDAVNTVLQGLVVGDTPLDERARLIIFIDDLDRCEESVVIQLLEAIKLYLGTSRCVFVLGMDTAAVLEALRHHWPNRSEDHNREYLEKLFQATLRVPAPRSSSVQGLLQQQLAQHGIGEPQASAWAKKLVELIEPNPRKLKNFTNSVCATWALHNLAAQPNSESLLGQLVLFQYLSLYHPAVWRLLERQPWALQILIHVLMGNTTDQILALPTGYSKDDQRMMEHYFSRAFSHVLSHAGGTDENKHRGLELDKAVDLFLERIDRKRSDEVFVQLAQEVFSATDSVADCFLCIKPIIAPEAAS